MADEPSEEPVYLHSNEDALEPRHLIRRSDVILRAGALMLGAGTSSRRVKETMRQVGRALDIDGMQAQITLNEIVLTVQRRGIFRTQVAEVASPGVNADRIAALQQFGQDLPAHMTVAEVEERLDVVASRPPQYTVPMRAVGAGAACAGFAFLNNGGPVEAGCAALAAFLGQYLRLKLLHRKLSQLAVVLLASVVAGAVYLGLTWALSHGIGLVSERQVTGLTSAVLFLIPGFPLITAALDLARLDLAAGMSRVTYAALVTVAAALGTWAVADWADVLPTAAPPLGLPPAMLLLMRVVATFVGVCGFAVVFNSPPRVAAASGVIATIANTPRLYAVDFGMPPQAAAALATLLLGLVAYLAGRTLKLPRIILSVPAVVIMVPGAAAYAGLVYFNEGRVLEALSHGLTAILVVVGMAVGLAAARMLTDPDWAFAERPHPHRHHGIKTHLRATRRRR